MIRVEFLGPIKNDDLEIKASNLAELKEILNKDESLKEWLEISAVAINDEIINSLNKELKNGDKVSILPPVCGG
ncbi:MoaD/ThiS family protein [Campylobacter ureolyticus]|uniref:MoaD/ThiS family protein n=1 Tax=Campylobacter ureolyticus TaxID=827 RepID=A0A9Q4KP37_9BACT|nr:MoaD/ThiS family protein [Campylobacter ureolyticus]MCZ6103119.1 MoaD/ThiS family protein [Campylobacter ureolyticus]MCZ6134961.1 MoaD/ThiS family protein [Campylobacter ureolyticus]MCZ6161166.1 MoaD/ThiS family protein [Campylobacter ureolyticus]MCZ6170130.1 MoaD/ThiS family protein [Campylobacter ureolyticus]MDU4982494.1 MoaD/ThiS family protein [Campylobacter ureolyticus]